VTKLKAELHALRKRSAHLQSQTARVEAVSTVPTGRAAAREPAVTINQLRADPVLTDRVSAEIDRLECRVSSAPFLLKAHQMAFQ